MRCQRCGRAVADPTVTIKTRGGPIGYGPKCAAVLGLLPEARTRLRLLDRRAARPDDRQVDWLAEVAA